MSDVPVTFTYNVKEYKGNFSQVAGAGSTGMYHLEVNHYYWGRLRYLSAENKWVFDPTPKTESLKDMAAYFEMVLVSFYS